MANELCRRRLHAIASAAKAADNQVQWAEGSRMFRAILTHCGTNQNRLTLSKQEARKAVLASPDQFPVKMAMKVKNETDRHPVTSLEEVGLGGSLEFIDDGNPRVEYVGRIYPSGEFADLAYNRIKTGAFEFDSYELDYEEGECSECGRLFRNHSQICTHLSKVELADGRFMVVGSDRASVIMHGVTFTGVSIMDRGNADPRAKILAVASITTSMEVDDMSKQTDESKTKEKVEEPKADATEALEAKVKDLEAKVKSLEAEKTALQETVDGYQAKEKEDRVDAIIAAKKARGASFSDDKAEKERLMAKSDEFLSELEDEINAIPVADEADDEPPSDVADEKKASDNTAQASVSTKRNKPTSNPDPKGEDDESTQDVINEYIAERSGV